MYPARPPFASCLLLKLLLTLALSLILGACGGSASTPLLAPTPTPTPAALPRTPIPTIPTVVVTPLAPTPTPTTTGVPQPELSEPTPIVPERFESKISFETLGRHGGELTGMAFSGDTAYLAVGPHLLVLDLSGTAPQEVFRSESLPGVARHLLLDGERLFWLAGNEGLLVFDLANPHDPQQVEVKMTYTNMRRMAVSGEQIIFAGWDCQRWQENCRGDLHVTDLSQPDSLGGGNIQIPAPVLDMQVVDSVLYLVHTYGLLSVDVSDPQQPRLLDEIKSIYIYDSVFQGGYAYLFSDPLQIIDLSEPGLLQKVGDGIQDVDFFIPGSASASAQRIYVFSTFGEFGFCSSDLMQIDISDPLLPRMLPNPQEMVSLTCVIDQVVVGERLYAADWLGLQAIDLGDGEQPQMLWSYPLEGGVRWLAVQDGFAYWGDGRSGASLHVVDLRQPQSPQVSGPFEPRWVDEPLAAPGLLMIPAWEDGLHLLSLEQPASPSPIVSVDVETLRGAPYEAAFSDDRLYVSMLSEGLLVIDLSQPDQPLLQGRYQVKCRDYPADVLTTAVAGSLLAVLQRDCATREGLELALLDGSDPNNPLLLSRLVLTSPPGYQNEYSLALGEGLALVSIYPWTEGTASGELWVIDVSDPAQARTLSRLVVPGHLGDVVLDGQTVYVAAGETGVWAVDVSDPAAPSLVGLLETPGSADGLALEGGRLYVADGPGGLLVAQLIR